MNDPRDMNRQAEATIRGLFFPEPKYEMITPSIPAEMSQALEMEPTRELGSSKRRSTDVVLTLFIPLTTKPKSEGVILFLKNTVIAQIL